MENKVKVWIARDEDGFVEGHKLKPDKMDGEWQDDTSYSILEE